MRYTGYKQAHIAKKVTFPSYLPLNKEGEIIDLIEESADIERKKQAILLLKGEENPDSDKYEVLDYFEVGQKIGYYKDGKISGNTDTRIYAPGECYSATLPPYEKYPIETRFIEVYPYVDKVEADEKQEGSGGTGALAYTPIMGKDWDTGLPSEGTDNDSEVNEDYKHGGWNRGTYYTRRVGEQEWTLENFRANYQQGGSLSAYKISQERLDKAQIPMTLEESQLKNGLFAFAATPSNRYFNNVKVYSERTFPIKENENLFGKSQVVHLNVSSTFLGEYDANNFDIIEDPKATAIIIPQKLLLGYENGSTSLRSVTITNTSDTIDMIGVKSYGMITGTGSQSGSSFKITTSPYTIGMGNYTPTYVMIILDTTGKNIENLLPYIKIEFGSGSTTWYPHKDTQYIDGWKLPNQTDLLQLYGMMGENLNVDNYKKHMLVKPIDTEIPWINNYEDSAKNKDILGVRFLPIGHKNNGLGTESGNDGDIHYHGSDFALLTEYNSTSRSVASPSMWYTERNATSLIGNINWDIKDQTIPVPGSTQYWQRNVRFVRNLTDAELGYKMWRKDSTDEILITSLSSPQPANTVEVPRGLLRGLAVRWLDNRDKPTKVIASLSYLLSEIEKCKDNGGYRWIGWESNL